MPENTEQNNIISKKRLTAVFFISLAFNMMMLMRTFAPGYSSDDIAIFFGAAKLAGLDWSGVTTSYHGQAYYFIFAPLFILTENPLTRHLIISIFNMITVSGAGTLIYYISIRHFHLKNSIFTASLPLVITALTSYVSTNVRNEVPVFLTVWLVCLILVLLVRENTAKPGRKRIVLSILLVITLCYGMLIHTRLQGFIIAVIISIFIYLLIYRQWIVPPFVFFPAMIAGYFGADLIRARILSALWDGRAATEVSNASLKLITNVSRIPGPRAMLDIFVNNIYALSVQTYGLAAIAVAVAAFIVIRFFISIKNRRITHLCDDIGMTREQFLIITVFGISVIGTILGLIPFFGRGLSGVIGSGEANRYTRSLEYTRYYSAYFGPLMLAVFAYFAENKKTGTRLSLAGTGVFIIILLYVQLIIAPYAGERASLDWFFLPEDSILTAAIIVTLLPVIYAYFICKERSMQYMTLIFAVLLVLRAQAVSLPFFNVVPRGEEGQVYITLKEASTTAPLPYEIYTTYEGVRFQYYFSNHKVIAGVPDTGTLNNMYESSVFICETRRVDRYSYLEEYGYRAYHIEDLSVWIRGAELWEALWK